MTADVLGYFCTRSTAAFVVAFGILFPSPTNLFPHPSPLRASTIYPYLFPTALLPTTSYLTHPPTTVTPTCHSHPPTTVTPTCHSHPPTTVTSTHLPLSPPPR